ncbi:hypothetical protein B0H14DRAFT_2621805 [Mycena olivaceomarginata]|nr:hypothetical protein B0H14DRAFT_2621805 [Mycena olivaceomarginata]
MPSRIPGTGNLGLGSPFLRVSSYSLLSNHKLTSLNAANVSADAQVWAQISTAQDSVAPAQSMPTVDGGWVWPIGDDSLAPIETGYWVSGGVDDWTLAASSSTWWETVSSGWEGSSWKTASSGLEARPSADAQYRHISGATVKSYYNYDHLLAVWHAHCDLGEHDHPVNPQHADCPHDQTSSPPPSSPPSSPASPVAPSPPLRPYYIHTSRTREDLPTYAAIWDQSPGPSFAKSTNLTTRRRTSLTRERARRPGSPD